MSERRGKAIVDEALSEHEATRARQPGGAGKWIATCCVVADELVALRADVRAIDAAWRAYCESKSWKDTLARHMIAVVRNAELAEAADAIAGKLLEALDARDASGVALAAVIDEARERV